MKMSLSVLSEDVDAQEHFEKIVTVDMVEHCWSVQFLHLHK